MYPLRKFTFIPFIKWSLTNFLEFISNIYYKFIRPLLNGHLNYSWKTGSLGIPKSLLLLLNRHHFKSQSRECVVWIFYFNVWSHYLLSHLCWANSRISFTELPLSKFKAIMADVSTLYNSQDFISNSPYCLPYSSCDVSLEDLVLDQLIIP